MTISFIVKHIVLYLGVEAKFNEGDSEWTFFRGLEQKYHYVKNKPSGSRKSQNNFISVENRANKYHHDNNIRVEGSEPHSNYCIIFEPNKIYIDLDDLLLGWVLDWIGLEDLDIADFHRTGLLFPSKKNQSTTKEEEGESPKIEKTGTWEIAEPEIRDLNRIFLQPPDNDPSDPIKEIVKRVKSAIVIVDFDNNDFSEEIQAMNEFFDQSDSESPLNFRECKGFIENHVNNSNPENMCWLLQELEVQEERREDSSEGQDERKEEHGPHVDMFGRVMQFIKLKGTIMKISESLFSPIMPREINNEEDHTLQNLHLMNIHSNDEGEEENTTVTSEETSGSNRTAPPVHDNRHINLLRENGFFSDDFLKDEESEKRLISIIRHSCVSDLIQTTSNSRLSIEPKFEQVLKKILLILLFFNFKVLIFKYRFSLKAFIILQLVRF